MSRKTIKKHLLFATGVRCGTENEYPQTFLLVASKARTKKQILMDLMVPKDRQTSWVVKIVSDNPTVIAQYEALSTIMGRGSLTDFLGAFVKIEEWSDLS